MNADELQAAKDAYLNLTDELIAAGIAENSNFAVINFSKYATSNPNLTAQQAKSAIQDLTASNNVLEGTKYNDILKGIIGSMRR